MYTVKHLCKEYHLSRSTLLYYDSIGLLKPTDRTQSRYRLYSDRDRSRLGRICTYREAGIHLEQIKEILYTDSLKEDQILTDKLQELNREIRELRFRQKLIIELLKLQNRPEAKLVLDPEVFADVLNSMGFDDASKEIFHNQFEMCSPQSHQFFLELLGLEDEDIRKIRKLNIPEVPGQ